MVTSKDALKRYSLRLSPEVQQAIMNGDIDYPGLYSGPDWSLKTSLALENRADQLRERAKIDTFRDAQNFVEAEEILRTSNIKSPRIDLTGHNFHPNVLEAVEEARIKADRKARQEELVRRKVRENIDEFPDIYLTGGSRSFDLVDVYRDMQNEYRTPEQLRFSAITAANQGKYDEANGIFGCVNHPRKHSILAVAAEKAAAQADNWAKVNEDYLRIIINAPEQTDNGEVINASRFDQVIRANDLEIIFILQEIAEDFFNGGSIRSEELKKLSDDAISLLRIPGAPVTNLNQISYSREKMFQVADGLVGNRVHARKMGEKALAHARLEEIYMDSERNNSTRKSVLDK